MRTAVRLQTQIADHVRYLVVVSTHDVDKLTLLIGMDYYKINMMIGVVLPLLWCSRVELAGGGGVAIYGSGSCSKADNALLFRPVSVQTRRRWNQQRLTLKRILIISPRGISNITSFLDQGLSKTTVIQQEPGANLKCSAFGSLEEQKAVVLSSRCEAMEQTALYGDVIVKEVLKRRDVLLELNEMRNPEANKRKTGAWKEIQEVILTTCKKLMTVNQIKRTWRIRSHT
ncbi:hypothetical protein Aduo_009674 [Ancylostoma duodenale]